jgi:hypothetical protein
MRWLQCPLREEFTLFHVGIDAETAATPTNERRDSVLRTRERAQALNQETQ